MLTTLIVFLVVLGLMVFVHELGHFLMAKRAGVRVEEFAFGFRPRVWGKKIGDTTYAINLIPLGGYVRMYGEQFDEEGPQSYRSKTPGQRFSILVAGAVMNLLMAWVILMILFAVGFQPFIPGVGDNPFVTQTPELKIAQILPDSPAQEAKLQEGDKLLSVNGEKVTGDMQFIALVNAHRGEQVKLAIERNGQVVTQELLARAQPPGGQGALGVAVSQEGKAKSSILAAPAAALYETGRIIAISAKGFVDFVAKLVVQQRVSEDVTGIVGVGALTGIAWRLGIDYLAQLVAIISIGLGVINLMPILPLDGGHIAALAFERVTGRPLSEKQFGVLTSIGLAFVLLTFLVVTYKDIVRFNVIDRFF